MKDTKNIKKNEKGEMVLSLDDLHQPWHIVFPGDKDWKSPYAEGYGPDGKINKN